MTIPQRSNGPRLPTSPTLILHPTDRAAPFTSRTQPRRRFNLATRPPDAVAPSSAHSICAIPSRPWLLSFQHDAETKSSYWEEFSPRTEVTTMLTLPHSGSVVARSTAGGRHRRHPVHGFWNPDGEFAHAGNRRPQRRHDIVQR